MRRYIKTLLILLSISSALFSQEAKDQIDFTAQEQEQRILQKEPYNFSVSYRLNVGYLQDWQHSKNNTYPDMYLHGTKLGITFDFNLPYRFSVQTGLIYSITYGTSNQHWKNVLLNDYEIQTVNHRVLSQQLNIPVFITSDIKLWSKLSLIFYTGPELNIGLAQIDYIKTELNDETKQWLNQNNIKTEKYERYSANELIRPNICYSLGGGLQWDRYRLHAGYTFGLNNLTKTQQTYIKQQMWNWSWNLTFSYRF